MKEDKSNLPLENSTTYLVENRQFIIRRKFGTQRTLSEILVTEISNGLLKNGVLNSSPNYRIIKP